MKRQILGGQVNVWNTPSLCSDE